MLVLLPARESEAGRTIHFQFAGDACSDGRAVRRRPDPERIACSALGQQRAADCVHAACGALFVIHAHGHRARDHDDQPQNVSAGHRHLRNLGRSSRGLPYFAGADHAQSRLDADGRSRVLRAACCRHVRVFPSRIRE